MKAVERWTFKLLVIAAGVVFGATPAFAGSQDGVVAGKVLVKDLMPVVCFTTPCLPQPSTYPLAGAKVTAHLIRDRSKTYSSISAEDGSYSLRLPRGVYLIASTYVSNRVRVSSGKKVNSNLLLKVY